MVDPAPPFPPRHDHRFATTPPGSSAISPGGNDNSGDRSPQASAASGAGSEQPSALPDGRAIDEGTSFEDGERRNGDNVSVLISIWRSFLPTAEPFGYVPIRSWPIMA